MIRTPHFDPQPFPLVSLNRHLNACPCLQSNGICVLIRVLKLKYDNQFTNPIVFVQFYFEHSHEKTNNLDFRPGPTQTGLYTVKEDG